MFEKVTIITLLYLTTLGDIKQESFEIFQPCESWFQHKVVFDNWYDCAQYGLTETKSLMTDIGPEVVNRDKITVSFVCKESSET